MRELSFIQPIDQISMRDFIARQDELDNQLAVLHARSFGKRVFGSGDIRAIIHRLRNDQIASRTLHPDLFTAQNIADYRRWAETLGE